MVQRGPPLLIFSLIFFNIFSHSCNWTTGSKSSTLYHVGVILDLESWNGNMSRHCISMARDDFYHVNELYSSKLVLRMEHAEDVNVAVVKAVDMLKEPSVQVIVGPQKSEEAVFVAGLGNKALVPVISFSATRPSLSRRQVPYFIRMAQNDIYQLDAIFSLVEYFRWKEVVLIYEETDYGNGIIPYLVDALQTAEIHVAVPHRRSIHLNATDNQILKELDNLSTLRTRVFIVHMSSSLGPRFFLQAKEAGLMTESYAWIITEELTNFLGSMDNSEFDSMLGVIGIKPYTPSTRELQDFRERLDNEIDQESSPLHDLNIFCLRAYDTIWALAMAAERVHKDINAEEENAQEYITSSSGLGISRVGPQLLKEIMNSRFRGLSGEISLIDGQLQRPVFEIINVEQGARNIGFWNPEFGLSRQPDVKTRKVLRPIIWPGDSDTVPAGWAVPGNGRKRRVGYPVKDTFTEFVKVEFNHSSNKTIVTGYCIDIFKAVMDTLPHVVYDFVPFAVDDVENGCNYNYLVHQVYLEKYDAVVGDITITADRSLHADFSHPYTTGGVQMVIPSTYSNIYSIWTYVMPCTWSVGLSCLVFLIVIVSMIVYFEYERKPNLYFHQRKFEIIKIIAKALYSPVNPVTDVTKVSKYLSVIFGLAVILVTGFYMQALYHLLFDDSQLVILDTEDILKTGEFVGYQKGSLVEMLLKELNFHESRLKVYNSIEEYHEALTKGSKNGGVAAIFNEIPYIKLLVNKFCGKYRRVGEIYKMEGFGFVFQSGSPLATQVSKAILSEADKIVKIEAKWLESTGVCHDPPNKQNYVVTFDKMVPLFPLLGMTLAWPILLHILAIMYRKSNHWFFIMLKDFFQHKATEKAEGTAENGQASSSTSLHSVPEQLGLLKQNYLDSVKDSGFK